MVYLIHFDKPYKHAKHYIGYCEENGLKARLDRHRRGDGSRLLAVIQKAGISWKVVITWPNADREFERRLKKRAATRNCPVCNPRGSKLAQNTIPHYI